MRTKQEVISFLESKVGTKVICVGNSSLDGQCVTLIKSLMDFLGVPNPYKARGHAKECIAAYLNEGIAKQGAGFLSVFSNKDMGGGYGHIWCNAGDGAGVFYESNGQKALTVTKGKTYSYDKVCNFDSYISDLNSSGSSKPESNNMTGDQFYTKFLEAFRKHKDDIEWGDDKHNFESRGLSDDAMIGRMIDNIARDLANRKIELEKCQNKPAEIVEKIVEKPVEVIKEVQVEVPVEKKSTVEEILEKAGAELNGIDTSEVIDGVTVRKNWSIKKK